MNRFLESESASDKVQHLFPNQTTVMIFIKYLRPAMWELETYLYVTAIWFQAVLWCLLLPKALLHPLWERGQPDQTWRWNVLSGNFGEPVGKQVPGEVCRLEGRCPWRSATTTQVSVAQEALDFNTYHFAIHLRTFIWAALEDEILPHFPVEKYFQVCPISSFSLGALQVI